MHDVQEAIKQIQALPTLPSVLARILSTSVDPEASALELGRHISSDQSLTAMLLKLVNSAYYGFYREIKTVTQAIVVLGFQEVRNVTLTATTFRWIKKDTSEYDRMQLWRHSIATAICADRCAKLMFADCEGCYEAGLLHDIGKVIFDMLYPVQFREAASVAHERQQYIREAELEVFGMTHAKAGALLADHWDLPPTLVDAIGCHHNTLEAKLDPQLAQYVELADYITYTVGLGDLSNGKAPELPGFTLESLKFPEKGLDIIAAELDGQKYKIEELIGILKVT